MGANTIKCKIYTDVYYEAVAGEAILPGSLVELQSDGYLYKHSTAGGTAEKAFLIEDALQGKGDEDACVAGDWVRYIIARSGDIVYALLADGENVTIGMKLESDGLGYLRREVRSQESWESEDSQAAHVGYDNHLVGIALEAQDLSALEGSESSLATNSQLIKVRIF
jgi:hypothetical protein